MSKTHFKRMINPDYLGAYSLDNGKGGYDDVIYTIGVIKNENIVGADSKREDCAVMRFVEKGVKPMIVNTTNMKTMAKLYKSPYIEDWAGKRVQIGVEKVKAFGDTVDALRIRPFVPREQQKPQEKAETCENCGETVKAAGNMTAAQWAEYSRSKINVTYCVECARKLIAAQQAESTEPDEPAREPSQEATDEQE